MVFALWRTYESARLYRDRLRAELKDVTERYFQAVADLGQAESALQAEMRLRSAGRES
jgi:hypothetical protein